MEYGINGSISIGFELRTVHTNGVCISTLIICMKCCPVCLHSLFFSLYPASTAAVCSVMPSGLCQGGTIQKQIERQCPEPWRAQQATLSNCACLCIYSKQIYDLWCYIQTIFAQKPTLEKRLALFYLQYWKIVHWQNILIA